MIVGILPETTEVVGELGKLDFFQFRVLE